jgi:hypothetical protein
MTFTNEIDIQPLIMLSYVLQGKEMNTTVVVVTI